MNKLSYLATLAIVLLALALNLSGCGDSSAPGATKKIRMAGIIFQDDQFFRMIKFGMEDAAKKNGVELLSGNSDNKPETEQKLIQSFQTKKVDAILISPLLRDGSVPALQEAHDKGILIVTNNTSIAADFPEGDVQCSAWDLGEQTGKAAVKYINEKLGGKATIAILAFHSQVAAQSDARTGGFKKQVTALPGVKLIADQDAYLTEKALKTAGDIITSHPDVNIIYAANEGGTGGAVLAVQAAGKGDGKIAVFGTDVSDQLLGFLLAKDNILQAITAQKPFEMGQMSVEVALKALKKEKYDKKIELTNTCLTRDDPAGVAKFAEQLKKWTAGGN